MDNTTEGWGSRVFHLLQTALFGVGFLIVKDVPKSTFMFIVISLIQWLQLSAFAIGPSPQLPWKNTPVEPISVALSFVSTGSMDITHGPEALKWALGIAGAWIAVFVGTTIHVGRNFVEELPQNEGELRFLRSISLMSTTTLFLPFTSVVFRSFACPTPESGWLQTGLECTSAGRVVISIVFGGMLVVFSCMSFFVATVFVDRNPASASWSAVTHGRVNAMMLLVKLLLSFVYNVLGAPIVGSLPLSFVLVLSGLLWYFLLLVRMPYTHVDINSFQASLALGYAWLSTCLCVAQVWPTIDSWLLVYVGTPIVACLGFYFAKMHYLNVLRQPLPKCTSMDEVNAWARSRMQEYSRLHSTMDVSNVVGGTSVAKGDHDRFGSGEAASSLQSLVVPSRLQHSPSMIQRLGSLLGGGIGSRRGSKLGRQIASQAMIDPERFLGGAAIAIGPSPIPSPSPNSTSRSSSVSVLEETNVEVRMKEVKEEAQQAYAYLTHNFVQSEVALVAAASFYEHHLPYHVDEADVLARAAALKPSLDVRFHIYRRSRQLRESDGSGLSPIDRIIFDQKMKAVKQQRLVAFQRLASVWDTLLTSVQGSEMLETMVIRATQLDETVTLLDKLYDELLKINPNSPIVLRYFASHLLDFKADAPRSLELLNKATRIEDSATKSNPSVKHLVLGATKEGTSMLDDNAAYITISGFNESIGKILDASLLAVQYLGFVSKADLIGQNINTIIPSPIREVHNRILQNFRGKRRSSVVKQTRLLIVQREDGALVPAWFTIMEAPPDEVTCEPRFTANISEVIHSEGFILFGERDTNYGIYGASPLALELLGVDGSSLSSERMSMQTWFPTIAPAYDGIEVKLNESHMLWIGQAVTQGHLDHDLARSLGVEVVGGKKADGDRKRDSGLRKGVGSRRRFHTTIPESLLSLRHKPGIIPVASTDLVSDMEMMKPSTSTSTSTSTTFFSLSSSSPGSTLLLGQVQRVAIPGVAPFFMLTFRIMDEAKDAALQARIAAKMQMGVVDEGRCETGMESGGGSRGSSHGFEDDEEGDNSPSMLDDSPHPLRKSTASMHSTSFGKDGVASEGGGEGEDGGRKVAGARERARQRLRKAIKSTQSIVRLVGREKTDTLTVATSATSSSKDQIGNALRRVTATVGSTKNSEVLRVKFGYGLLLVALVLWVIAFTTWVELRYHLVGGIVQGIEIAGRRGERISMGSVLVEELVSSIGGSPLNDLESQHKLGQNLMKVADELKSASHALYLLDASISSAAGVSDAKSFERDAEIAFYDSSDVLTRIKTQAALATVESIFFTFGSLGENVSFHRPELVDFDGIVPELSIVLEESIGIRHFEAVEQSLAVQREFLSGCIVFFVIAASTTIATLLWSITRIRGQSFDILSDFEDVPRRVLKILKRHAMRNVDHAIGDLDEKEEEEEGVGEKHNHGEERDLEAETKSLSKTISSALHRTVSRSFSLRLSRSGAACCNRCASQQGRKEREKEKECTCSGEQAKELLWMASPLGMILVFLVAMISYQVNLSQQQLDVVNRAVSIQRAGMAIASNVHATFSGVFHHNISSRSTWFDQAKHSRREYLDFIKLSVLGGVVQEEGKWGMDWSVTPLNDNTLRIYNTLITDPCIASTKLSPKLGRECREFRSGLFTHGVLPAMHAMSRAGIRVEEGIKSGVSFVNTSNTPAWSLKPALKTSCADDLVLLLHAHNPFLKDILDYAIRTQVERVMELEVEGKSILTSLAWTLVGSFFLIMFLFFFPKATVLGTPLRAAWRLYLLLPQDVLSQVGSIKRRMRKLTVTKSHVDS